MSYGSLQTQKNNLLDKRIEQQARGILEWYRQAKREIEDALKTNYAQYLTGVSPDDYWTVLNEQKRLAKMNAQITGIYTRISRSVYEDVKAGQLELFNESYYRSRFLTESFVGTGNAQIALNPLVSEFSVTGDLDIWNMIGNERLAKIAQGIAPNTGITLSELIATNSTDDLIKIQRVIKQGLITGRSYSEQIKELAPVLDNSAYKTQRIVRTEGNRNMNAGAQVERETAGVAKKKRWVATLDANTREDHQRLDGQTVGINEKFSIGGDSALYPGDFSDASQNINCRCTTIDIIEGLEPTARRGKNPLTGKSEIISYKDYDEWKMSVS